MAAQYDPDILQQYADDLYSKAKSIAVTTALIYVLVVFVISFVLVAAMPRVIPAEADLTILAISTVIGICAGVDAGRRKAFSLKLQAQQILCQRQIELNTRQAMSSAAASGN